MRYTFILLVAMAGCSGPVPLQRAVTTQASREYEAAAEVNMRDLRPGWYAWKAQATGASLETVRTADRALSTTRNPFNANRDWEAVTRGAAIFSQQCARCHGVDVRGHGADMLLDHPTADFHAFPKRFAVTLHGGAPRAWFKKINEGYGDEVAYPAGRSRAMPAFGQTLAREQVWLVITYLQSLDANAPTQNGAGSN